MPDAEDIKIACMSLMWGGGSSMPDDQLDGWLAEAVAAGYAGVATFEPLLLRWSRQLSLKQRLADHGLALASTDWGISKDFGRLREVCETMQAMGCVHLVALGGVASREAEPREIADLLNEAGDVALRYGIRAGYHNHTGNTGETLEETEQLLRMTDPEKFFGFLDVGHATKDFVGHPPEKRAAIFLERNWDRIDFLEFKDWCEEHDLCTELGAGRCDYPSIFRMLKDRGYRGWITVEQNGPMGDRTLLQSARASRQFIRDGLGV